MVTQLGEIQLAYSIGGVTYTRSNTVGWGMGHGNPYFVLAASGGPADGLNVNQPHITIWGDWSTYPTVDISTVEFTWNTTKHLEYRLSNRKITPKSLNWLDLQTATSVENLLVQFLVNAQFVANVTDVQRAYQQAQAQPVVQPQQQLDISNQGKWPTPFESHGKK